MKRNLMRSGVIIVISVLLLFWGGCNTRELEDRGFPLAIGIDKNQDGIAVSFDLPDLTQTTENKNPSGKAVNFAVEAGAYYEAQKAYENNTNRILDYNHLKAIIISEEFLADREAVEDLLSWLEHEEVVARNTCLFIAKDSSAEILSLTRETNGSVGKYLEQMLETQEDFKENKIMTIGDFMNQRHNQNEALLIPVLTNNGEVPSITEYAVVDAYEYKGNITVEDTMKSFLCQGLLNHFLYTLADGTVVEIQNIRVETSIGEEKNKAAVTVEISGNARLKKGKEVKGEEAKNLQSLLNDQLNDSMTRTAYNLLQNSKVDITNSFCMLGGYARDLYQRYQQDYDGYESDLKINFITDIKLINE